MITKVTYDNKEALQNDDNVQNTQKVTDKDMNEIKEVINGNAEELLSLSNIVEAKTMKETLIYKGTVNTKEELGKITDMQNGWLYNVLDENKTYAFNGTEWIEYGVSYENEELQNKADKEEVKKLNDLVANKVDKESGKGLSTNDYTTEEKKQLASVTSSIATRENYIKIGLSKNVLITSSNWASKIIPMDTLEFKNGSQLQFENNGITIGANIKAIRVTAIININGITANADIAINIRQNGNIIAPWNWRTFDTQAQAWANTISTVVKVKEGDTIELWVYSSSIQFSPLTRLIVEAIS